MKVTDVLLDEKKYCRPDNSTEYGYISVANIDCRSRRYRENLLIVLNFKHPNQSFINEIFVVKLRLKKVNEKGPNWRN